jgi:hypothetical protein
MVKLLMIACQCAVTSSAELNDVFKLLMDPISMVPLHVSYSASNRTGCTEFTPAKTWTTSVLVEVTAEAPRPLRVAEAAAPGATEEKSSGGFFSSWVHIRALPELTDFCSRSGAGSSSRFWWSWCCKASFPLAPHRCCFSTYRAYIILQTDVHYYVATQMLLLQNCSGSSSFRGSG